MKHVELICEAIASISVGGPINKKKALDDIVGGKSTDRRTLQRSIRECVHTLRRARAILPRLRTTRFANAVDFYSLAFFIWDLDKQGCVLSDRKRNRQADRLLIWLS